MRKLLLITYRLSTGGAERVITMIANELSERGYDVTLLSVINDVDPAYFINKRVKIIRQNIDKHNGPFSVLKSSCFIRKTMKKEHYDCIVSFKMEINTISILACLGRKEHIIVSERNSPGNKIASSRNIMIHYLLSRMLYYKAKNIVFQTEDAMKFYSKRIQKKSVIIENPVNPFLPLPVETESEKRIVAVGRLCKQKNHELLINAFVEFHHEYPEYRLQIFGDGELREHLSQLINKLDLNEIIELKGFVSNITDEIKNAKMFVLSSDYEGIPNAVIEAMAIGLPVVCSDCPAGGVRKMVRNGENGLLFKTGDKDDLITKMKLIMNDRELEERLRVNSVKIRDTYSIDGIVDKWEELIQAK